MPGKVYEYAVLRLVPRVEREEFINLGVVVYVKDLRWLQVRYRLDQTRVLALWPEMDLDLVQAQLNSFACICAGGPDAGPIGKLDVASRFRWLTAMRSTIVQTSRVHPGLTEDPAALLERLFEQLVPASVI